MKYGRYFIYVMQFEYEFQYLIPHGSDIHQDRITMLPRLDKRILWRLGLIKTPYNKEQVEEGETILLSGAMKTLDVVTDPKYKKEKRKKVRDLQEARSRKRKAGCLWQTREFKEGAYYMCLTHKEIVRMKDGVNPKHK